eukprot:GFKZ01001695.1.p1 GENE.GFKZ01001695.1~~GFKZ01001695.1.p1  ORF type:complete len:109 (-),score=3.36 GFKZ01001695.1:229-555(-)
MMRLVRHSGHDTSEANGLTSSRYLFLNVCHFTLRKFGVQREICCTTRDLHLQPEAVMTKQEDVCGGGHGDVCSFFQISVDGIADRTRSCESKLPFLRALTCESGAVVR